MLTKYVAHQHEWSEVLSYYFLHWFKSAVCWCLYCMVPAAAYGARVTLYCLQWCVHVVWQAKHHSFSHIDTRLCHYCGGLSLISHCTGPGSIPGQSHLGFVVDKLASRQIFLQLLCFLPVSIISLMLLLHLFIPHIRSCTTGTIQLWQQTVSVGKTVKQ